MTDHGDGPPQLLGAHAGHWTGDGTGVTVIIPPPGTVGSGEVRGGAPATREFALLDPTRLVDRVDAVVMSGGSAYGLAAGHGLMDLLRERGMGVRTPHGVVPIVVGMSIFDGSVATTPPGPEAGRAAALAAWRGEPFGLGRVGAGTGASTGHWRHRTDPGGVGWAELAGSASLRGRSPDAPLTTSQDRVRKPGYRDLDPKSPAAIAGLAGSAGPSGQSPDAPPIADVAAVVVVNAWGDVLGPDGRPLFGGPPGGPPAAAPFQSTTVACVLTNARLSKTDCYLLAQSGHSGFARAIHPAHSRYDGDAVVALATGDVPGVDLDLLRAVAVDVVAEAIRSAVGGEVAP